MESSKNKSDGYNPGADNKSWEDLDEDVKDDIIRYYDYARKEIEREDKITYERTVTTLSLQGFLVTAISLMIGSTNPISSSGMDKLLLLLLISFSGIFLSVSSLYGVGSSRKSLYWAKDEWVEFNRRNGYIYPRILPQITRRSNENKDDMLRRFFRSNSRFIRCLRKFHGIEGAVSAIISKGKKGEIGEPALFETELLPNAEGTLYHEANLDKLYDIEKLLDKKGYKLYFRLTNTFLMFKRDPGSVYFQSIPLAMSVFWISVSLIFLINLLLKIT